MSAASAIGKSALDHPGTYLAAAIGIVAAIVIYRHFKAPPVTGGLVGVVPVPTTGNARVDVPGGVVSPDSLDQWNASTDTLLAMVRANDHWAATGGQSRPVDPAVSLPPYTLNPDYKAPEPDQPWYVTGFNWF